MKHSERTRQSLIKHYQKYPKMQITDIFKYLHQSSLGCGHMISSEESAIAFIGEEYAAMTRTEMPPIEALDGEYSRVSLDWLSEGLSAKTLGRSFYLSAKEEPNGKSVLLSKIDVARQLVKEGKLPFSLDEFEKKLSEWSERGYPAVRHSEEFRKEYSPAYRVISNEYVRFLPLLSLIDRELGKGTLTVAVEGGSASGKTTLASLLSELYDCTVFHMDDFFLRPEQRTRERFSEIGGNVDRERFFDEILLPLSERRTVCYRPFDCQTQTLGEPISVEPKGLTIVEGAYSMHPSLAPYYDLSVFLDIEPEYQRERILKRNSPQLAKRFFEEWIPMEREYFAKTKVANRCDLVIKIKGNVTLNG
jgi:uridine kinase